MKDVTKLGNIADIYDGPHATPKKIENGKYFLSISSLDNGSLDLSKSAFISDKDFIKWTKRVQPQKDDLLFSYETRLGEAALMPDNLQACLGRRMGLLRPKKDKVIPQYLLFAYLSPEFQKVIRKNTIKGATVDRIALNELGNFPIYIPDLKTQQSIADVLSALDKKITLNKQINARLEEMAKTLYDYWFVQFDFPDANGKPYKSSGGEMVFDETLKREIPKGWEVKSLNQVADIVMGQSPDGASYNLEQEGTIFFQGSTDFDWRFPNVRQYTTSPTRFAQKGDILLSVRAPVGDLNISPFECCIGRGLAALRSKSGNNSFLFYVMKYFKTVFERRNTEGTTFGSITKDDLHSLKLVVPADNVLEKYNEIASKYDEMIFIRSQQNHQLTQLRDFLLPMLMNGQVSVAE